MSHGPHTLKTPLLQAPGAGTSLGEAEVTYIWIRTKASFSVKQTAVDSFQSSPILNGCGDETSKAAFTQSVFLLHSGVLHLQRPQHRQPDQYRGCEISHNQQRAGKTATYVPITLLWFPPFDYLSLCLFQEGPVISFNAQATLKNFCIWQQSQNVLDDNHHSHHDTAILITRSCETTIVPLST